ncbi:MAG: hypothetical protein JF616_20950 [Fibrobacteres bacterium]|nr:hypothetical protein [Fibrobacterota bacterium]
MKTIIRFGLPLLAATQLWAQTTQPVHPGFTLTSLRPANFNPMVSGIDFLSDGRMVLTTWDGFGKGRSEIYLISGFTSGDASKVTYKTFYKGTGLNEVLGVKVVDDKIYVMQKDGLSYLPDADKNDSADNIVKVGSGFVIESNAQNLEFALGLVYKDSAFYAGLATNWTLDAKQTNERGCVVRTRETGFLLPSSCTSCRAISTGCISPTPAPVRSTASRKPLPPSGWTTEQSPSRPPNPST